MVGLWTRRRLSVLITARSVPRICLRDTLWHSMPHWSKPKNFVGLWLNCVTCSCLCPLRELGTASVADRDGECIGLGPHGDPKIALQGGGGGWENGIPCWPPCLFWGKLLMPKAPEIFLASQLFTLCVYSEFGGEFKNWMKNTEKNLTTDLTAVLDLGSPRICCGTATKEGGGLGKWASMPFPPPPRKAILSSPIHSFICKRCVACSPHVHNLALVFCSHGYARQPPQKSTRREVVRSSAGVDTVHAPFWGSFA